MTQTPMAAPPAPTASSGGSRPDEILVAFAGSARQRRLTVLVRLLLVIPHAIILLGLGIGAYVVVIIGWFAALVLGRLPGWAADYLSGWLRYNARVAGYLWLLTDTYPPFTLADADYPVRLAVAPGRLNRFAVLFRVILVIPAWIVAALVSQGVAAILLVIWLIVLIGGRLPDPLHQAMAAVLRLTLRFNGYLSLLTGTYPWWGLFGDKPAAAADEPATLPPAATATPAAETPAAETPAAETPAAATPAAEAAAAEAAAATGPAADVPPVSAEPASAEQAAAGPASGSQGWRLILSSAARNLVVMFLVLGVGVSILNGYLNAAYGGPGLGFGAYIGFGSYSAKDAARQIGAAHTALVGSMGAMQAQVAQCQSLACVTRQDTQVARLFDRFGTVLQDTGVPGGAAADANARLGQDTARIAADFRKLATATSVPEYRGIAASTGLQQALNKFDADYHQLGVALGVAR